jgi:hypothetical protein
MKDAAGAMPAVVTHDEIAGGAGTRSFAVFAGTGAILGAIAGVVVAVPLAAAEGPAVFLATALDVAAGLALIGGLIAANIAGTD